MNGNTTFLHFKLSTQAVAIGERVKGGTFRPCIETIPTSTLKGAFKEQFGLENIAAIGFFDKTSYEKALFTYAPFDAVLNTSKLPITLEYLKSKHDSTAVTADVYVLKNKAAEPLIKSMPSTISIGALKSKDFGRCSIDYIKAVKTPSKVGYLKGRLIEEEATVFGIVNIIKASYGYLFYPKNRITGVYKRALFEGSIIEGPEILIDGEYGYDAPD
jgi:hypothetical protein